MEPLLLWLEETSIATFVREADTVWGYPTVLFMHTVGLAMVAGFHTLLNLRVLGVAPKLPFSALTPFVTATWVGFALATVSGTALFMASASYKAESAIFIIKLVLVALAVVVLHLMSKQIFRNPKADSAPLPQQARMLAVLSIVLWAAATTAGRLIAYII